MNLRYILPSAVLLSLSLVGCPGGTSSGTDGGGGIDTGPASFPDCAAIIEACHYVDPGTGPIHDCHETAHDAASNAPCAPISASCVAMCEAIDGGLSDLDGGHAHDEDAGGHAHDEDAPAAADAGAP